MKRSDMLKDINILIEDGLKNQHSVETISRSVLEYQESQGILAPEVSPLPQSVIDNCESGNYWEDEDEA